MNSPNTFCSRCGSAYAQHNKYPRSCSCGAMVWENPIPVAVVMVPIFVEGDLGVLVARRAIQPGRGRLALPGGFVESHETWQQAAAREVLEETGVCIDPACLRMTNVVSTDPVPNRILIFSTTDPVAAEDLPPFAATAETSERGVVFGTSQLDDIFAFPLHVRALRSYMDGLDPRCSPHSYRTV